MPSAASMHGRAIILGSNQANFEHPRQQVISRGRFAGRMLKVAGLWLVLTVVGLLIGMTGYAQFEDMSLTDAYVNAAMILSGMGPLGELKTTAGKLFAGSYCAAGVCSSSFASRDRSRMAETLLRFR